MKIDGSIRRIMARGFGETECLIFSDNYEEAARRLSGHSVSIIAGYPFISAHAAYVHIHNISEIAGLSSVRAITSQSRVYTLEGESDFSAGGIENTPSAARRRPSLLKEGNFFEGDLDDSFIDSQLDSPEPLFTRAEHLYCGVYAAHSAGNYGTGCTIAVIDTGISPHLDFVMPTQRIAAFADFVEGESEPCDNFGHGTAVASIACGNGLVSNRRYAGVAPKAQVIGLRAIGDKGEGGAFKILESMQWIIDNKDVYNIRVACMSFGAKPQEIDPIVIGAEALWDAGIAVVASCGNAGPAAGTVMSPACSPKIISVGAVGKTDFGFYVPSFSSRGGGNTAAKPDIAAPAVGVTACSAGCGFYAPFSGTSMAAPEGAELRR